MKLSIIGTGYVGLVTAVCFASQGHTVFCVEHDQQKVEKINNAKAPIYEKNLGEYLIKYKNNITATTDYEHAILNSDIAFICVGTPTVDHRLDLSYIKESSLEISQVLKKKKKWYLVVVKSTVLPGTTENVVIPIIEHNATKKVGKDFGVAMNPEFLREGLAIKDFLQPDRIVIGYYDDNSKHALTNLYKDFSCPMVYTTLSGAEMIKYASNAFLASKISFINEIGNLCKHLGINTYDVADGMGYDRRIGRAFLDSGIGWGGSCFPKDLDALISLAEDEKIDINIIKSVVEVNHKQPLKIVDILKKHIPCFENKTIGILGLAFKPDTDDIRESRAIPIVGKLLESGAKIKVYDPQAMNNFRKIYPTIAYCSHAQEVFNSEAILILTKWDEFKRLDFSGKLVVDGRKLDEAKKTALTYEGVCW